MPRIAGVDVPNDKRIIVGLTYVYGIGRTSSARVLETVGIEENVRGRDLTDEQISRIVAAIDKEFVIEGQLRRQTTQNLGRLRDIACYRGLRHRRGLPVRGQRTRTNARTRKGRKKTVATKRSVKAMR